MTSLVGFVAGLVFALGLGIGGMTRPVKVLAFLDLGGHWDPSLAFVMAGAILVHAPLAWLVRRRRGPLLGGRFVVPATRTIDGSLLAGAAIFGVGWGLAGFCPGPGITALASGKPVALVFVVAMLAGMLLQALAGRTVSHGRDAAPASRRPDARAMPLPRGGGAERAVQKGGSPGS